MMKTAVVRGINIYPFESADELIGFVEEKNGILVAINAEKILYATERTREIINRNIGYCDGYGAVMALRKKGFKDVIKIPGCELWLKIIEKFYKEGKRFYLVGGHAAVIEATVAKLKDEYKGINIVNYRDGYIKSSEERAALIEDVAAAKPDVVFVAMGSPKQELLMEEMFQRHPAIYQGLGGSFDVYTGAVNRAPQWWVDHNLEWAYRLIKQPSRFRRQIHLVRFLIMVKLGRI